jgi:Fe2+ transport system protein B
MERLDGGTSSQDAYDDVMGSAPPNDRRIQKEDVQLKRSPVMHAASLSEVSVDSQIHLTTLDEVDTHISALDPAESRLQILKELREAKDYFREMAEQDWIDKYNDTIEKNNEIIEKTNKIADEMEEERNRVVVPNTWGFIHFIIAMVLIISVVIQCLVFWSIHTQNIKLMEELQRLQQPQKVFITPSNAAYVRV